MLAGAAVAVAACPDLGMVSGGGGAGGRAYFVVEGAVHAVLLWGEGEGTLRTGGCVHTCAENLGCGEVAWARVRGRRGITYLSARPWCARLVMATWACAFLVRVERRTLSWSSAYERGVDVRV